MSVLSRLFGSRSSGEPKVTHDRGEGSKEGGETRERTGTSPRTSPRNLSGLEAKEFLKKNENVVLDLWAAWCRPCRALRPIFDAEAGRFSGQVAFGRVNIERDPSLAERFEVRSIPTLLFFHEGELVRRHVGMVTPHVLERQVRRTFRL